MDADSGLQVRVTERIGTGMTAEEAKRLAATGAETAKQVALATQAEEAERRKEWLLTVRTPNLISDLEAKIKERARQGGRTLTYRLLVFKAEECELVGERIVEYFQQVGFEASLGKREGSSPPVYHVNLKW